MYKKNISLSVIRRLPKYYRFLASLKENGIVRISSREFSERLGLSASQVRQDLNCFGGFGQQGYGYNITNLYCEIGNILGANTGLKTVLIGAGNLGKSIAKHLNLHSKNLKLIGIFDKNEAIMGQTVCELPIINIEHLDDFCKESLPVVAILCVPSSDIKEVVASLANCGVIGFWNFTDYDVNKDFPNVIVEKVHLTDSMMTLCYQIKNR